jgi:hypothetical protein
MKDLWADLQVDGDDEGLGFSLEHLEKELAHLDDADYGGTMDDGITSTFTSPALPSSTFAPTSGPISAASFVVSTQQTPSTPTTAGGVNHDAWQQSLQKFTAMSLEQDFLAADSARKSKPPPSGVAPPGFMEQAEEYNVSESIPAAPPGMPPGLMRPQGMASSKAAAAREAPKDPTPTPRNSMVIPDEEAETKGEPPALPSRATLPQTPHNSVSAIPEDDIPERISVQPSLKIPEPVEEEEEEIPVKEAAPPAAPAWQGARPTSMMPHQQQQGMPPQQGGPPQLGMPPQGMQQGMPPQGMMMMPPQGMHPQGMHPQGMMMPPHPGMMQGMPPHPGMMQGMPPQGMPPQGMMQGMPPQGMPPQGMMSPQRGMPPQGMPPQQQQMPMGIPVPQMMKPGTPWQSPPPPQQQPQQQQQKPSVLYCHTHPSAPPIPAASIDSSVMTNRDLGYVLHSMLRPVLNAGNSPSDYHMQFMQRRAGGNGSNNNKTPNRKPGKHPKSMQKEMKSRAARTTEWSKDKSTLGRVTKTDASRPRALLSVSAKKLADDDDADDDAATNREARASLWKARLYIDQGQEAATALRLVWQSAEPNTVPTKRVQPHLLKLFKVLGIQTVKVPPSEDGATTGSVSYSMATEDSLAVILKLSKGKTFVARLLEHALLPPNAVQVLVPVALKCALTSAPSAPTVLTGEAAVADRRLFGSFTRVLTMLPQWSQESLLACLAAASTKDSLSSQTRMECLHSLLRRGNATDQDNEEYVGKWKTAEAELMKLLS